MKSIKQIAKSVSTYKWFELSIMFIILLNSVLIGVELYTNNETIKLIQNTILGIFTIVILLLNLITGAIINN